MERLTIRNSDGSVSQPTDLKWAEALERLAAYEDTRLLPEDVASQKYLLKTASKFWEAARDKQTGMLLASPETVHMLVQAHFEGKTFISPCKIGARIYRLCLGEIDELKVTEISFSETTVKLWYDDYEYIPIELIGTNYFLSYEEAEAARQKEGTR